MSNIEKIRAEIERLAKRADRRTDKDHASHNAEMERYGEDYWNGYGDLAYALLSFLSTLSEEPDSKEFTEEFDNYFLPRNREQNGRWGFADIFNLARHFAEWQKQQMLKDAVEGKVFMSFAPGHNQMVMADVDLPTNTKVKLIIVKED